MREGLDSSHMLCAPFFKFFFLLVLMHKHEQRDMYAMCVFPCTKAMHVSCEHMFWCMIVQRVSDMFQHKTNASPNSRLDSTKVENTERGRFYLTVTNPSPSLYNRLKVMSLGLGRYWFIQYTELGLCCNHATTSRVFFLCLISHGFHNQSASFMDKEVGGRREDRE